MEGQQKDPCCGDESKHGHHAQKMPTIFEAIKAGMLVPVQTIVEIEGPDVLQSRDDKGHTPAHWACLGGHATILRFLIENKAPFNEPSDNELAQVPMHWACVNGHIAVVDILLTVGVPIDVIDTKGCSPLIVACQYGKTMLAGYLMGKGARTQLVDKDGDTALHWAAFKGHNELMRLLIYSGFNPHQRDNYGQTPIHLACINGNLTSVQELCEQDQVEMDIIDKNGKTPLMLAVGRKHEKVVQYIKKQAKQRRNLLPKIDIWAVVFGPPGNTKGPLLFFVLNLLVWGYPMYIFKCLPGTWYDLQYTHIVFMALNVVMWVCLYHASTLDPGFLPRNVPEYDRAIKEVAHFDEWKQGSNPLSRLCHTCRTVKPMRSKHCRICNRCVESFDHHCPYIYNCVGMRNRVWFAGFVFSVLLNGLITVHICLYMLQSLGWDWVSFLLFVNMVMICGGITLYFSFYLWTIEGTYWYYPVGILEAMFFEAIAVFVGLNTIYHMVLNLTTNERINYKRYEYLKDGRGKYYNPYNRGHWINILEFFHLRRPLTEEEVQFLNVTIV